MTKKWYCVVAKHGKASTVEELLRARFKVFRPLELLISKQTRKYKFGSMLGDYVFVLFDVTDLAWHSIYQTRDVKDILGMSKYAPTAVPFLEIRLLVARCALLKDTIKPGNLVRVIRGQYAGMIGLCEYADRNTVALTLIGEKPVNYAFNRENVTLTKWKDHNAAC